MIFGFNNNKGKHMLVKEHYKLYKDGKLWVAAAIGALSIGASTVITNPHPVAAAFQVTQTLGNGTKISFRDEEEVPVGSSATLADILQPTINGSSKGIRIDPEAFDSNKVGTYGVKISDGTGYGITATVYVVATDSTPATNMDSVGSLPNGSDMAYYWRTDFDADPKAAHPQTPLENNDSYGVPFFPYDFSSSVDFSKFVTTPSVQDSAAAFGELIGGNDTLGFAKQWRGMDSEPTDVKSWVNNVVYADGPHKGEEVNVSSPYFEHDPNDPSSPAVINALVQVGAAGDNMVAMKTYPLQIVDDAPQISSDSNIQVQQNDSPLTVEQLMHATATDTEDGELPVKITSNYDPTKVGKYDVEMTATDKYGVQTVRHETITVTDHDVYSFPFTYVDENGNQIHDPAQTDASVEAPANILKYDVKGYTPAQEIINESNRGGGVQSLVADFEKQEVQMYSELNGQGKLVSTIPFSQLTPGQLLQMGIETATGTVPLTSGTSYNDLANAYDFASAISDVKFVYKEDAPTVTDEAPELNATDATGLVGTTATITDLLKASATDKEDGNLTPVVQVINDGGFNKDQAGKYNVTLGVTDKAGHFVTKNYTITLTDGSDQTDPDAIPTLTASNASAKVGTTGSIPALLSAAATDKEDGDLTSKITVVDDGGFDKDKTGTYNVTLNVKDSNGHSVTGKYTITLTADNDNTTPDDNTKPGDDSTKPGDDTTKPGDNTNQGGNTVIGSGNNNGNTTINGGDTNTTTNTTGDTNITINGGDTNTSGDTNIKGGDTSTTGDTTTSGDTNTHIKGDTDTSVIINTANDSTSGECGSTNGGDTTNGGTTNGGTTNEGGTTNGGTTNGGTTNGGTTNEGGTTNGGTTNGGTTNGGTTNEGGTTNGGTTNGGTTNEGGTTNGGTTNGGSTTPAGSTINNIFTGAGLPTTGLPATGGSVTNTNTTTVPTGSNTATDGDTTGSLPETGSFSANGTGTAGSLPDTGSFPTTGANGVISTTRTPLASGFSGVTSTSRTSLPNTFGGTTSSSRRSYLPQTGDRTNSVITAIGVALLGGIILLGGLRRRRED
ncbi:KxYKxGKxW signal peptide domain-containing protein [Lacticaseibacillus zhaodongensis]|uniref:KxYKxGKxW signal peptide domain-containing protein n=1 Tax=Lacticaseibacillus zhaodongensis TaxID=2668065 RepID=UPI0012D2DAA2|nr:KxYKxGKxW signal peptide domain-containing protein [Lacticaseibacillus zhaodongensis]